MDQLIYPNPVPLSKPEPCDCPDPDGCSKTGYQYADISIPIELKPNVSIAKIETECCGDPLILCKENPLKNTCEITLTQKIVVKIPVNYKVTACIGEETINCSHDDCGCK